MNIYKEDLIKFDLLDDTLFFNNYFFKKQYGRKFIINHHHKIITEKLDKVYSGEITRLIINIAPRYSKTELAVKTFISKGFALNPKSKFIHTTYSDPLALDNSETIRSLIKTDYYQEFFNVTVHKKSDAKCKWYTEQGGGVYAVSSGGAITGFGAGDLDEDENNDNLDEFIDTIEKSQQFNGAIIIDDPIKPSDALSKIKRDMVNQRFDNTIRSRVNSRNTPIIIIMQRVHKEDLTGYLLSIEPNEWEVLSLPVLNENNEALWPFKHTKEELLHLQKINYFVFQTQYQQNTENIKTGGEFYKNFDPVIHVHDVPYMKGKTIGVAVDNNVLPYIAVSIWQVNGKEQRQIHEIPCRPPYNSATSAGNQVVKYLELLGYDDIVFIYGDQTTTQSNTIDDDKKSFLDKFILSITKKYKVRKRMQTKNPPVALSGEFVDAIFANHDGMSIVIDKNCTESIKDYQETKEDLDGKILKKRITDPQTGQSYEEHGHFADLIRYKNFVDFKENYRKFAKGDFKENNYTMGQPVTDRRF